MSCGSPVDTHSQGLIVLCTLQSQNSLTCAFAQVWPDIVKAFLTTGEQRAALCHGTMIKKPPQAVRQGLGVLGETSLLICVLTSDSVGLMRLPCRLVHYLNGGLIVLLSIQRVLRKKNRLGGEQVLVQESGES